MPSISKKKKEIPELSIKKFKTKKQLSISKTIQSSINFSKENDPSFKKYCQTNNYKKILKNNPTIHMVNNIFLSKTTTHFIEELLLPQNKEIYTLLNCCFVLLETQDNSLHSYPAIKLLTEQGFNTIYDIMLENYESFFLYSFLNKMESLKKIKNVDKFMKDLVNNPLYKLLRQKIIIEQLQINGLFSRIKKYQL